MSGSTGTAFAEKPSGVARFKLCELEDLGYLQLGRGDVISKLDMETHPGDFPVYSSSAQGNGEFGRYGCHMFDDERITWSVDGGGKFFHREPHKYSVTNVCGWLKVTREDIINTKYLYYCLISSWGGRTYDYTVKAHPSVIRQDYSIDLPPMEIQLEIVQVLDSFVELEKSIENELRARKKQFEFYSRKALAFVGKAQDGIRGVNFAPLSSLARRNAGTSITARQMKSLATRNGDIKVFAAGSTTAVVSAGAIPHKDVYVGPSVVVKSRGYIGSEFVDSPFSHKSELWSYTFSQEVEAKFVNYWLQTKIDFLQKLARSKSVKLPQLAVADTDTLLVPQPPIGVQTEIVASLDSFRTLISQLEAELELRQLQSMYYRDKLLSFRES